MKTHHGQFNIFQMEGPTTDPTSQPGPGPLPQPEIPAPSPPRDTWAIKNKTLLSFLQYSMGFSSIWRFPYLCYRNGGGVFLIPYFFMLLVVGLPLLLMELSLCQYGSAGPITVWKCCPLLKGIGVAMLIVTSLVAIWYNVITAWALYYLGSSFQCPLPWSCNAPGNRDFCQNTSQSNNWFIGSEAFWNERVLGMTHTFGFGDPGTVQWPLALCLLTAWIFIFVCVLKDIRTSGKVMYFTATFPYLVILVLIIRGATLDGSLNGIRFYLSSDWSRLQSAQAWSDAASQVFYSLGIGFVRMLSIGSNNKFENNIIRDTLVIAIKNCFTSLLAGFAIFSVLGHMAWRRQVPVAIVDDSGLGLVFVAYPEALSLMPGSQFWSILFFLVLFTRGVDILFENIKGIITVIVDEFPALRDWKRKTVLLGALCTSFYLLGLLLVTQGGIFWLTFIDTYRTGFGLTVIALFMNLGISFCYGVNQFCQDIRDMICQCPPWWSRLLHYFRVCWTFLTPCLLLFMLIFYIVDINNVFLLNSIYKYPTWVTILEVCLNLLVCLQIPVWAIVALCSESGTLRERFQKATQPLPSWRRPSTQDMAADIMHMSVTSTLMGRETTGPTPSSSSKV